MSSKQNLDQNTKGNTIRMFSYKKGRINTEQQLPYFESWNYNTISYYSFTL